MNLPDLLRRKDRAVVIEAGAADACMVPYRSGPQRAIRLSAGTRMRLRDAHGYSALRDFPTSLDWTLLDGASVRVSAIPHAGGSAATILAEPVRKASEPVPIQVDWPLWTLDSAFDLMIESDVEVTIGVGKLLDPRLKMAPLIKGHGVELGPGLTPRIMPRPGLKIDYVEEKTPEEWRLVYGHGRPIPDNLTPEVLASYRVGSASTLEQWEPESLDFVFTNHVFEHLMNPLQVLLNWLGRLRPGGCVLAVVPDARYTFDLRQSFSTLDEILAEEKAGSFAIPDSKFAKWCEGTTPQSSLESLKQRNYPIHVHYYTPAVIRDLVELLIGRGACRSLFLDTAPNNKDFAMVIRR